VEISRDAKLPEIVWKFRRSCAQNDSIRNPHFYPNVPLKNRSQKGTPPLGDRGASGEGQTWTEHILVYGDDAAGCIKLTSEDGPIRPIMRIYGAVTCDPHKSELTIFKGLSDYLSDSLTLT